MMASVAASSATMLTKGKKQQERMVRKNFKIISIVAKKLGKCFSKQKTPLHTMTHIYKYVLLS